MTEQEMFEQIVESRPAWVESAYTTVDDIRAIQQGGCASGAYMPAVTYYDAARTMSTYGDDVLEYIQDCLGELPRPPDDISWSGLACHYLSAAVEMWASTFDLEEIDDEQD